MIEKERIVSAPDFGEPKDPYYNGSSTGVWWPDNSDFDASLHNGLYNSPRVATLSYPFVQGTEQFSSTTNKRPLVNYVKHKKINIATSILHGYFFWTHRRYYTTNTWYYIWEKCKRETINLVYPYAMLPLPEVGDARRRAYWQMLPRFRGELDSLNAIIELKDFRGLSSELSKLMGHKSIHTIGELVKNLRKAEANTLFKGTGEPTLNVLNELAELGTPSSSTLLAANVVLTTNLAIRPLLKDISQLIVQLKTTAANAQSDFIKNGQTPYTTHYTEVIDDLRTLTSPSIYTPMVTGKHQITKFVASMERTYSYNLDKANSAFRSYWGLDVEWETIWNAIPFSFVADYFLTIGKSMSAMQVDKAVDLHTRSYYESVLTKSTSGTYLHSPDCRLLKWGRQPVTATNPQFVAGLESSYYHRYPSIVDFGAGLPRFKKPKAMQTLNMLALARVFC